MGALLKKFKAWIRSLYSRPYKKSQKLFECVSQLNSLADQYIPKSVEQFNEMRDRLIQLETLARQQVSAEEFNETRDRLIQLEALVGQEVAVKQFNETRDRLIQLEALVGQQVASEEFNETRDRLIQLEALVGQEVAVKQFNETRDRLIQLETLVGQQVAVERFSETRDRLIQLESLVSRQIAQENPILSSLKLHLPKVDTQQQKILNMLWLVPLQKTSLREEQKRYWSRYPKATGVLQTVQQCNLMMMKQLKKLCEENHLLYWLHGGTLIGGVRHHGFIPWDDDVDIGMMRKDLCALTKLLQEDDTFEICEYYHEQNCSKGYQFKYRNGRIPCFIDIVPFDFCNCNSLQERIDFLSDYRAKREELMEAFITDLKSPRVEDIGYYCFGPYSAENKKAVDKLLKQFNDRLKRSSDGNCIYYAFENFPFAYPVMPVGSMFPTQKLLFEGDKFNAPLDPELYLSGYGDIWQIPADIEMSPHLYYYKPHLEKMEAYLVEKRSKEDYRS